MRTSLAVWIAMLSVACGQAEAPDAQPDPLQSAVSAPEGACELTPHPLGPRLELRPGLAAVAGEGGSGDVTDLAGAVRAARRGSRLSILVSREVPAERVFVALREALHGVGLVQVSWIVGRAGDPVALELVRLRGTPGVGDPHLRLRITARGLFLDAAGGMVDPSCERGTSDRATPTIPAGEGEGARLGACLTRIATEYPDATLLVEADAALSAQRLFDVLAAARCVYPLGIGATDLDR